ncbi:MAG: PucR family transcriptional regulator ligand-binding domain-containing protein [Armatimonadota bacterium]|nr:PucR family transcriptional regulator ligand-binding domain-containing protein [Armatimonadota bacterium]MDR5704059.1 PucR family transcriptional regulator ligand-binding domain-containing protein [Armatimonadota bacterium]
MGLTVREALQLEVMRPVRIVAGHAGLDREIRWVHIIDIPEITPWVRGGELLLTTGYGWPVEDEERRRTVRELNAKGLAAILFEPSKFLQEIPRSILEEAEALHLPILEAPWELAFVDITEAVSREIIKRQYELIERADEIHRALTLAAVEATDLGGIAKTLSSLIGKSVTIEDPGLKLLAHAEYTGEHDPAREATIQYKETPREIREALERSGLFRRLEAAEKPVRLPAFPEVGMEARIVCPIRAGGELLGYIWILEGKTPLNDLDLRAAEHAATVAALHLLRQRSLAAVEERIGYTFVDGLIRGAVPPEDLMERARLLGFDPQGRYAVVLMALLGHDRSTRRWPLTSREDFYRRERMGQTLRWILDEHKLPRLLTYTLNQIICLIPAGQLPGGEFRKFLSNLYRSLELVEGLPPLLITAGTPQEGAQGIPRSYWEAERALLLAKGDEGFLLFEDLTLTHLLSQVPDRAALRGMYEKIVGPLLATPQGVILRETVWSLVDHEFNQNAAAKTLGIHRNTMRARIQKIEALLGRSLKDARVRWDLFVAREIERIL